MDLYIFYQIDLDVLLRFVEFDDLVEVYIIDVQLMSIDFN